jgi:hypothetical protein
MHIKRSSISIHMCTKINVKTGKVIHIHPNENPRFNYKNETLDLYTKKPKTKRSNRSIQYMPRSTSRSNRSGQYIPRSRRGGQRENGGPSGLLGAGDSAPMVEEGIPEPASIIGRLGLMRQRGRLRR